MIIKLKGATFSKNINDLLNSFSVTYSGTGVSGTPVSIPKNEDKTAAANNLEATINIASNYTYESLTVRVGGNLLTAGTDYTVSGTGPVTLSIDAAKITGNVVVSVQTSSTGGDVVDPDDPVVPDEPTSNYTLIHGNKYAAGNEENTARASIQPLTIKVPTGVTITNKPTIKWAYYKNVDTDNMPSGTGNGLWGDYTYTGTGVEIGIAFKKVDDSVFDWNVDSTNPADYFDVSDEGLWDGTAEDITPEPEEPSNPEGTLGDITAITLVNGNPYGTADQQVAANRVHGETALYAPAGTVISCKDTTTYKWALRRVKSETDLSDGGDAGYKPDAAWTTKTSYTTTVNGYWCFILLKASNADFDWSVDSNKVSDYFTAV